MFERREGEVSSKNENALRGEKESEPSGSDRTVSPERGRTERVRSGIGAEREWSAYIHAGHCFEAPKRSSAHSTERKGRAGRGVSSVGRLWRERETKDGPQKMSEDRKSHQHQ